MSHLTRQRRRSRRRLRLGRPHAKLMVQYATTRALAESATLDEAAPQILRTVCDVLGWEAGALCLTAPAGDVMQCSHWHVPEASEVPTPAPCRPGEGLVGRVWKSRKPTWFSDVATHPALTRCSVVGVMEFHGAVAVPILLGESVRGVIAFFSGKVRALDKDQFEVLMSIGSQIGQFIERKRAEAALKETAQNLTNLIESMFEGIVITQDGIIREVNRAVTKILGCSRSEMIGTSALAPVAEESQQIVARHIREGHDRPYEAVGVRKDGTRVFFEVCGRPFVYNGQPARVTSVHDLTARKAAEAALRESEERFRTIFEAASDIISLKSPDGTVLSLNRAFETETGWSREDWIGKNFAALVHPEDLPRVTEIFRRAMLGERAGVHQTRVRTRAGTYITIEYTTQPVFQRGRLAGTLSIARNVTQRQRLEEEKARAIAALRASEELYRTVVEGATDMIAITDPDGTILTANRAVETQTGWPPEQWIGKNFAPLIHPDDMPRKMESYRRAMAGEHPPPFEIRFLTRKGTYLNVEVSDWPLVKDGKVTAVLCIVRDITERRRQEEERTRLMAALLESRRLQAIGQLAAGVAHEINTPMQFIGDNTHFLRDAFTALQRCHAQCARLLDACAGGPCDPETVRQLAAAMHDPEIGYLMDEIPRSIQEVLEGVERVTSIVRAMKEFGHPAADEKTEADVNEVVESAITVSRNEWKYVADVVKRLDSKLPPVPVLRGELNSALVNLIVNAAHAIAERVGDSGRGTITISTRRDGDFAEISVSDTGTGIPEAIRDRIFEPFFTTKGVGKGTGQGLAIAWNAVVDKHGGTLSFETQTGRGTTFFIRLPVGELARR